MGNFFAPVDQAAQKVQQLKKQINLIVSQHKVVSDRAQKLIGDLEKLDFKIVGDSLKEMNLTISQNLNTIITDQQNKLDILRKVDMQRLSENPQSTLDGILKVLDMITKVASFFTFAFASNPVSMALEGLLIAFDAIMNIFNFLNNISQIEELTKKLQEMQGYFAGGGQYYKDLQTISEVSFQLVENYFMFIVAFNGMIEELSINVNLLTISEKYEKLNYAKYMDTIFGNPVDQYLFKDVLQVYSDFIAIRGESVEQRVNKSGKLLEEFQNNNDVVAVTKKMKHICDQFQKDTEIGKALLESAEELKRVTALKDKFSGKFQKRKTLTPEELPRYDKNLLEDLLDEAKGMENPTLAVAEVVSFFTAQFFGDDPTGTSVFGKDLEMLFYFTENLNSLGTNSSGQNIIYLRGPPQPRFAGEFKLWSEIKQNLEKKYEQENPDVKDIIDQRFYMRMQVGSFNAGGQDRSKLNYFYGLSMKRKSSAVPDFFEKPAFQCTPHVMSRPQKSNMKKIQHFEEQNSDLKDLCKYMTFYINLVAYPERVIKFSVFKQENKFKAVLAWSSQKQKPEYFGRILQCHVCDLSEQQMTKKKEDIFYEETFAEDKKFARLSFK